MGTGQFSPDKPIENHGKICGFHWELEKSQRWGEKMIEIGHAHHEG